MRRGAVAGAVVVAAVAVACGAFNSPSPAPPPPFPSRLTLPPTPAPAPTVSTTARGAAEFLDFYNGVLGGLTARVQEAEWHSSTDVSDKHEGERVGAESAMAGFSGSAYVIKHAKDLLAHPSELDDRTARQLRYVLLDAAQQPALDADLLARHLAAEAKQASDQDGFVYCLTPGQGSGAQPGRGTPPKCAKTASANDIDDRLRNSRDLKERLAIWKTSKGIGVALRAGLLDLRELRNATAHELGYPDFFSLEVGDYGMSTAEMMALLDKALADTKPLLTGLQCYARRKLAERYKLPEARVIPATWVGNRWAQSWPGLVEAVDLDPAFKGKEPAWFAQQAERYYVSMGFPSLPARFWEKSDLYPVKPGEARHKNSHATAWHIDLDHDVRSLMNITPTEDWFLAAHHELGHIYYYLAYSTPSVPPVLRRGANRAYHEAVGELISMSVLQEPYLRQLGLLAPDKKLDPELMLLDAALEKGPVFLAFAAGTMAHFEHDLYAADLPASELNARWWKYVTQFQGVAPPEARGEEYCDACSKTHINDDPAQYYDYALAALLQYQLHEHFCRDIVHADPHACTYAGNKEVGEALRKILAPGASRDWRVVLKEVTGEDLSAAAMLRYFAPLLPWLEKENAGHPCGWE
jgi:peptidyl-dipeptidase A